MDRTETDAGARRTVGRRLLWRIAAITIAISIGGGSVLAQQADESEAPLAIAIPAQDLNAALLDFARITGLQLLYDTAVVAGRRSAAIDDRLTPSEGLTRLLAGSGVVFRRTETGAVALSPAPAQGDAAALNLGPIVVEGDLLQRTAQETPVSVAVFDGVELDQSPERDIFELFDRAGNVNRAGPNSLSIRGIDARGVGGASGGLVINTEVDGVSLPVDVFLGGPNSTWDLQQVEVLRGPQTTRTGRNALAGAVIVRSNDPTYETEIKARGDLAMRESRGAAVALNAPIVDGVLAARVSAEHQQDDGFIDNPTLGDDVGDSRLSTVRGKLLFEPTDALSIVGGLSFVRAERGVQDIDPDRFPDDRISFDNTQESYDNDIYTANLRVEWNLNDRFTLESETAYLFNENRIVDDLDGAAGLNTSDLDRENTAIEQDVRLRYGDDRFDAVLGGVFNRSKRENDTLSALDGPTSNPLLPPGSTVLSTGSFETETLSAAGYGEAEVALPEIARGLSIIAGGRYDRTVIESDIDTGVTLSPPLPVPLPDPTRDANEVSFSAFLPKVGLAYDWTEDFSTAFIVQRGYRGGGSRLNLFTQQANEFDAEFTWNYELSLRSQWFDDRLTVNANAFYVDWKDQQVIVFGPSGNSRDFNVINAGESRLFGGEVEIRGRPAHGLDLFGSFGFSETEFLDFEQQGEDLSGNRFAFAPRFTASIGGSYFFDNGIELHLDANYASEQFADVENTSDGRLDNRVVVNTRIGYQTEHFGAFLYARNLFDEDYLLDRTTTTANAGEPLTVGGYLTVNF